MLVKPGDSLSGFLMMSRGLPGIRQFTASPRFDPTQYLPDPDEYPDSAVNVDSLGRTLNYYGWTVGPTAPPENFIASSFIDTLVSYKHQALSLGWIDNQGVANSLDSKLENARSKLDAGDSTAARNLLDAFLNEVEAQNGKHLTNEAYVVLKYNAKYLIDRLPAAH